MERSGKRKVALVEPETATEEGDGEHADEENEGAASHLIDTDRSV